MEIGINNFEKLSSFGFAILDANYTVKKINGNLAATLQRSRDWLEGKNMRLLIPSIPEIPSDENHTSGYIKMENGQVLSMDIIRIDKKIRHYLLFCQDHSQYDHILDQIAISSKKKIINDKMLDNLFDGCYIADGEGHALYFNDAFLEMSGLKRDQILNKPVQSMIDQKIIPKSCTSKVIETGKPTSMIIDYYKGKSCLVTGAPVFIDGKLERVICTVRDMTELLALKDKLANETSLTMTLKHQLREIEYQQSKYVTETRSKAMNSIYEKAIKVASFNTPVLVLGETGVGKDFLVRFIYNAGKGEPENLFIKINCGAIPGNLLESELFGYEAGAFTDASKKGKIGLFELANNGTLFLDEIGELPLNLQVKLLDVIQDKSFYRVGGTKIIRTNARIVSATNSNLEKLISEGKFRRDLYYRLNVVTIVIPPLRDRKDDIILLAISFLDEFNDKYRKLCYFAPELIKFFMNYQWPGNIREMKNVIERLVIMSTQERIEIGTIEKQIIDGYGHIDSFEREMLDVIAVDHNDNNAHILGKRTLREQVEFHEKAIIQASLKETATLRDASEKLGIDVSTLVRKKQKYHIH